MNIKNKVLEIRYEGKFDTHKSLFLEDDEALNKLVKLIVDHESYPIEEYAAWMLTHICKENPQRVQKFYKKLVDCCFETENQSVLRSLVNVINHLEIKDYRESEFIDLLISFIQNPKNKVALHVYSIYVLTHFIRKYPELKSEISEVILLNSEGKTAAYAIGKRNFFKEIEKI